MAFIRKDLHKKKRLTPSWRKPRGLQNKMRLSHKGHTGKVRPGYGTKNTEKHMFNGKDIVQVSNIEHLKLYDPKTETLNIAKVSTKNKVEIINEAIKKGFSFANFNAERYLKAVEEKQKQKLEAKKAKKKAPTASKTKAKETPKTEEKSEEEVKKEKDKILTKSK
jgi:large subunit ribosomal protein L32e